MGRQAHDRRGPMAWEALGSTSHPDRKVSDEGVARAVTGPGADRRDPQE